MLNYIKAELYRTFNRKYFYFFIGIFAALVLSLNIFLKIVGNSNMRLIDVMALTVNKVSLMLPIGLIIMLIDMINGEEYKNGTLKNTFSFGVSKSRLMLSKFITIIILAFITEIIVLFISWTSGVLLFGITAKGLKYVNYAPILMIRLCAAVPLWIAVIAVGLLLNTIVNNYNMFIYTYIGVFCGVPLIIKFLSMFVDKELSKLNNLFITGCLNLVGIYDGVNKVNILWSVAVGLVYIVVCMSLALVWFSKKDVK